MKKTLKTNFKPAVTLFFLAPIISELLFGSTPVSRAYLLIIECLGYGTAALLIREFARRRNLGWFSIIILGIAFGAFQECLLLQSVFNPFFLNNHMSFGRYWGVNWVWAEAIIIYHGIWSVAIPILFTELLFPDQSAKGWLSKTGIFLVSGLSLLNCFIYFAIFYKMSGYLPSPIHFALTFCLIVCLIRASLYFPVSSEAEFHIKNHSFFLTGFTAFVGSSLWLSIIALVFSKDSGIPPWLVFLSGLTLAVSLIIIFRAWARKSCKDLYLFSLAVGALSATMLFGLIILMRIGNKLNEYFQIFFITVTAFLLVRLKKTIAQNVAAENLDCQS